MTAHERQSHWDGAYAQGAETRSWYQEAAGPSLDALDAAGVDGDRSVIDIGAGASTLVDALLDRGHTDITCLDVSPAGLAVARARLGERAAQVTWVAADLLSWQPARTYDVWHDRAVLHFLTDDADRAVYRSALAAGTRPGSVVVLATFALDGPTHCSGLPVHRDDAASLAGFLGPTWTVIDTWREVHHTPSGADQSFTWLIARRH